MTMSDKSTERGRSSAGRKFGKPPRIDPNCHESGSSEPDSSVYTCTHKPGRDETITPVTKSDASGAAGFSPGAARGVSNVSPMAASICDATSAAVSSPLKW